MCSNRVHLQRKMVALHVSNKWSFWTVFPLFNKSILNEIQFKNPSTHPPTHKNQIKLSKPPHGHNEILHKVMVLSFHCIDNLHKV